MPPPNLPAGMFSFPLLITFYAGMAHAFEADHLLAVGNIVTQRNNTAKAAKDGLFWGLGHTCTIVLMGALLLLLKVHIAPFYFNWFEGLVGMVLITLGGLRLVKLLPSAKQNHKGIHPHSHFPFIKTQEAVNGRVMNLHAASYGVGLLHGLAGSGELVVLVMLQIATPQAGMMYLMVFGIGSVLGMVTAAAMISAPFSKNILGSARLQAALVVLSSVLCIGYGIAIVYRHWV